MQRLHRFRSVALLIAASISLYALSGCASQNQEAATPPPNDTALKPAEPPLPAPQAEPAPAQPQSDEATKTAAAPEDFPLPIVAGMQVKGTLRTQTGDFKGMQVEITGDASPQAVADFYEAEFKKRNLNVSKMNQKTDAGEEILVLGQSERITAGVAANRENNQTRAVLSWSEKQTQ